MNYANGYVTTELSVGGGIDNSQTSGIILASVTGVLTTKPGALVITWSDPLNESTYEIITYTSINGSKELQGVTRAAEGSTARSHDNGAVVAFPIVPSHINDINDKLTGVDTTVISDTNDNEILKVAEIASAVNELTVTNAATGNAPKVSATGGDANIDLELAAKGTGKILQDAIYQTPVTSSPSAAATDTLDLSTGNEFRITMPAGNITIAIDNETDGQKFMISILQDGTGSRTVTWFSTIKWAGGSAPTLTTTPSKRDVFGFIVTGTDTYDGFVVGQDI